MKLSIIIPVFNEERTIDQILEKVYQVKVGFNLSKEVIIVDDGSKDRTKLLLKKITDKNTKIIHHSTNLGKGAALRTGFKACTGDLIIIQDADLEYDPKYFYELINPIINKKAQVVYGSRLINYPLKLWGKDKTSLPTHWMGNKFLTGITNLLYNSNLTDMETCYKIFTKEVLSKLDLKSDKFEIEPEITAKILKKDYKIVEVPIKIIPRTHQEGKKISAKDGIAALWALIKYRFTD